jgi:hypothetical protein
MKGEVRFTRQLAQRGVRRWLADVHLGLVLVAAPGLGFGVLCAVSSHQRKQTQRHKGRTSTPPIIVTICSMILCYCTFWHYFKVYKSVINATNDPMRRIWVLIQHL